MSYSRFLEYLDMGRVKKVLCGTMHRLEWQLVNALDMPCAPLHKPWTPTQTALSRVLMQGINWGASASFWVGTN